MTWQPPQRSPFLKTTIVVLTFVYFWTNVAFANMPPEGFWQQHRATVQSMGKDGSAQGLPANPRDAAKVLAQVPSPHSMRMFTEPGRRVQPHCTAVGKALLAELPPGEARALLERDGMPAYTPATITDPDLLIAHLEVIRKQGYAVDEGEQEIGVRCFAVAVPDAPGSLAISTSGPQTRMTDDTAARIVPALKRTAREISETIAAEGAG